MLERLWLLAIVTCLAGWAALLATPGERAAQLIVYAGSLALILIAVAALAIGAGRLLGFGREARTARS